MMDREKHTAVNCQSFFLTKLVLPLMSPWVYFLNPERGDLYLQTLDGNKDRWESLVAKYMPEGTPVKTAKAVITDMGGGGGAPGAGSPQVDGKVFFREVRGKIPHEAFNQFLASIKRLNSQQQTREE